MRFSLIISLNWVKDKDGDQFVFLDLPKQIWQGVVSFAIEPLIGRYGMIKCCLSGSFQSLDGCLLEPTGNYSILQVISIQDYQIHHNFPRPSQQTITKRIQKMYGWVDGKRWIWIQWKQDICDALSLSNNYISSMQFCSEDSPLLPHNLNHSFALRRNIRIKSSKLPPDFFNLLSQQRYAPSPLRDRPIAADISNRNIRTPSFEGKRRQVAARNRQEDGRKVETARPSLEKAQNSHDLISGVLSTSKNLRRVFRKQSLDFKECYSMDEVEKQFRLPKILNRGQAKQL